MKSHGEMLLLSKVGKYNPLKRWLQMQTLRQIDMTFDEISDLVGGLPPSAVKRAAWWANETAAGHVQCKAWLDAGYVVHADRNARKVRFSRLLKGNTCD